VRKENGKSGMNAKTKAFRARELSSHMDAAGSAPPEAASPEAAYAVPQAAP